MYRRLIATLALIVLSSIPAMARDAATSLRPAFMDSTPMHDRAWRWRRSAASHSDGLYANPRRLRFQIAAALYTFNRRRSLEMKIPGQWMKSALMAGAALLALPTTGVADKGGNPNAKSEAATAACLVDDDTVHVYTWVKHDDLGEGGDETYDGVFDCGTDAEGTPVEGPITLVAIKSGSRKNTTVPGAPRGSGQFLDELLSCDDENFVYPLPGECEVPDDPEPPLN